MDIKCSHFNPVTVKGSLRSDSDGGLIKTQHCDLCGAIRSGAKKRRRVRPAFGSAWEPWVFGAWKEGPTPALVDFLQGDQWPTGTEHTRRAAWRPVMQPCSSDLLENREAALSHIRTLIAIHGFRPADLAPNSDDVKTS